MDWYLRSICESSPLTRPWNDRACLLPAARTKVYFEEIKREGRAEYRLGPYLGSWVKAWKPALEATRRRMAWKWLSSSALMEGSSASWDKRARMALLMSFSLFSEKRPWRGQKKNDWGNELESCLSRWVSKSHRSRTHSHLGLLHAALHCTICWRWIWTLRLQSFHLSKGRRDRRIYHLTFLTRPRDHSHVSSCVSL